MATQTEHVPAQTMMSTQTAQTTTQTEHETPKSLPRRLWLQGAVKMALLPVVFLAPAGTWRWPEGWALIIIYSVWAGIMTRWLVKHDPDLLRERAKWSPIQEGQKSWDKVVTTALLVSGIALFVVPGLDAVRYQWSSLPWFVELIGFLLIIASFVLVFRVMRANTYLAPVVKIDRARGHKVITTGPYRYVRHPMYVGVIVHMFALPVALGSRYGLIASAACSLLLVIRTHFEDRTLHQELDGYEEYAQKTRYRLLPGVW